MIKTTTNLNVRHREYSGCCGKRGACVRFQWELKSKQSRRAGVPQLIKRSHFGGSAIQQQPKGKSISSNHGRINLHSPIFKYHVETSAHRHNIHHDQPQSQQQSHIRTTTISSKNRIFRRSRNTFKPSETTILGNVKRASLQTAPARRL